MKRAILVLTSVFATTGIAIAGGGGGNESKNPMADEAPAITRDQLKETYGMDAISLIFDSFMGYGLYMESAHEAGLDNLWNSKSDKPAKAKSFQDQILESTFLPTFPPLPDNLDSLPTAVAEVDDTEVM